MYEIGCKDIEIKKLTFEPSDQFLIIKKGLADYQLKRIKHFVVLSNLLQLSLFLYHE